jgi:hypothetical protein
MVMRWPGEIGEHRCSGRAALRCSECSAFMGVDAVYVIAVRGKVEVCDMIGGRRIMNERE